MIVCGRQASRPPAFAQGRLDACGLVCRLCNNTRPLQQQGIEPWVAHAGVGFVCIRMPCAAFVTSRGTCQHSCDRWQWVCAACPSFVVACAYESGRVCLHCMLVGWLVRLAKAWARSCAHALLCRQLQENCRYMHVSCLMTSCLWHVRVSSSTSISTTCTQCPLY